MSVFGTKHDYDMRMALGVIDYTDNWKCSNCGECCSNMLPLTDADIRQIKATTTFVGELGNSRKDRV